VADVHQITAVIDRVEAPPLVGSRLIGPADWVECGERGAEARRDISVGGIAGHAWVA
jgi:hypothetical protein